MKTVFQAIQEKVFSAREMLPHRDVRGGEGMAIAELADAIELIAKALELELLDEVEP